jgi:hypothetical protein
VGLAALRASTLQRVYMARSTLGPQHQRVARVFGENRYTGLYYVSVFLTRLNGEIVVGFLLP